MKISNPTDSYRTNITSAADFGINDNDLSHIMGILRSQIYSDKLLAVIREYSTNAVDANIEANNNEPIYVQLPTIAKPTLSFRDYGNGLTDQEVTQLYIKYGASTKRNSNDYTGCLGIGCKAAFAYGDSFQITSYTTDRITTWFARIDESKRGTISLLDEKPNTGNPTGVNISITIRSTDIETCQNKAKQFFKYWRAEQIICSETIDHVDSAHKTDDWMIAKHSEKQSHSYYARRSNATVVMGNIAYPVPASEFQANDALGAELLHHEHIIFYAKLGSLDIAANREALELTDRTRNSLETMASNMMLDLIKNVELAVAKEPSRIQASIKALMYEDLLGSNINTRIAKNAKWNGLALIRNVSLTDDAFATVHKREKSWRNAGAPDRNVKDKNVTMFTLTEHTTICVTDDTIKDANATRRIRTLQAKNNYNRSDRFVVIHRKFLKHTNPTLTKADYTDLLDVEPLKPNRTIINKSDDTKVKQVRINVCKLKPNYMKSARLSDECTPEPMSDGRYVYIPLDRYDWNGHNDRLDNLSWFLDTIQFLNNDKPVTVYGVKKHHLSKLDNNWIVFDKYYGELLNKWIKKNPSYHSKLADRHAMSHCKSRHAIAEPRLLINVKDKNVASIASAITYASEERSTGILAVGKYFNVYTNKSDIENRLRDVLKKYPLLKYIGSRHYEPTCSKEELIKELNNYINSK